MNWQEKIILKLVQQALGYKVKWTKREEKILEGYEDYILKQDQKGKLEPVNG